MLFGNLQHTSQTWGKSVYTKIPFINSYNMLPTYMFPIILKGKILLEVVWINKSICTKKYLPPYYSHTIDSKPSPGKSKNLTTKSWKCRSRQPLFKTFSVTINSIKKEIAKSLPSPGRRYHLFFVYLFLSLRKDEFKGTKANINLKSFFQT